MGNNLNLKSSFLQNKRTNIDLIGTHDNISRPFKVFKLGYEHDVKSKFEPVRT